MGRSTLIAAGAAETTGRVGRFYWGTVDFRQLVKVRTTSNSGLVIIRMAADGSDFVGGRT
ncbi:MAG: hypothetical protein WDO69_27510 [Pseudomonadota bacterium]